MTAHPPTTRSTGRIAKGVAHQPTPCNGGCAGFWSRTSDMAWTSSTTRRACSPRAQVILWCYSRIEKSPMPATTTLKLPDSLKARIAKIAGSAGKSPHAFMVDALEAQTALAERRQEFIEKVKLADSEVAEFGLVYDADEVFSYLRSRLEGKKSRRPSPVKLST